MSFMDSVCKVYGTYAELEKHAGVEYLSAVQLSEEKATVAEGLDRLSEDRRTTRIRAGRYPTHQRVLLERLN